MISFLVTLAIAQSATSDYNGFTRTDYKFAGLNAIVVEPKVAAKGRPWIWRLEFFDHRPMLDVAMLKLGYHLVHLEVGNTFGCPAATDQFSQFYAELTGPKWNLSKKCVLEGFSRGGLYAYNWAVRNPDKVQAIYGDAPVCDFKVWPRGFSQPGSQVSNDDWKSLINLYGFPSEKEALEYPFNPLDNLEPLVKAHIPIIHVVGDADKTVPVASNTAILEERYKKLGGTIVVIHKPGVDHHPHSLDNPQPIVDFLLAHAHDSLKAPPATLIPAPNPESRYNAAGWGTRSWVDQFQDGAKAAALPEAQVVLLGDSVTQGFGGPLRQVGAGGGEAYAKSLAEFHTANEGISGDRVQNVLWRIQHGALKDSPAKVVLVMIGINNALKDSPESVVKGIEAISAAAHKALPMAVILIQPVMPGGEHKGDALRTWTDAVNAGLVQSTGRHKIRLAFKAHDYLLLPNGDRNPKYSAGDGIHLSNAGYSPWAAAIRGAVLEVLRREK